MKRPTDNYIKDFFFVLALALILWLLILSFFG